MSSQGGAFGITTSTDVSKANIKSLDTELKEIRTSDAAQQSVERGEVFVLDNEDKDDEPFLLSTDDPFPVDPNAEVETQQFTVRAVLVGCILGGVIAASNLYLGLKTGWTFGAGLFGSMLGYAIIKPLSKVLPTAFGGGYFGPKENCCVQSAATAAGSLGLLFTSGFPAAYQIGLLGKSPKDDFGKLITFTACCAYYGMFFAIPLRKFYIIKQKLVFPGSVAAAHILRSLHTGKNAEANAKKKVRALVIAFGLAITLRVTSEYAPGLMWDWHWGWTFYRLGWTSIIGAENWNFIWEWTPAFIGVGMLSGINASYSFAGGTILAWGIIGPAIVASGKAFGSVITKEYPEYISYTGMVMDDPVNAPTPRYWLVWPGTLLLLCGAFAELGANYKTIWACMVSLFEPITRRFMKVKIDENDLIYDPCPQEEQVPMWMWGGGLILSMVFSCVVLGLQYKQNVGVTIVGILFAFIFSFIGAESTGRTNITPVTSIGNASQLVIGGITRGHYSIADAQLQNLMGGMLALGASLQSADMLGDLKTTHLIGASPRVQFYAQLIGSIVAIFMSTAMYVLFSTAYPCINDLSLAANCAFPAPDVGAWRAIAIAVTDPTLPIPPSSGYTAIGFGVLAILVTVVKYRFVPVAKHKYVPNVVAIGIAFILPTSTYPFAMAFGATIAFGWAKYFPALFAMYCYAVAAGMIAGEGLGGIVGAILQVAGVSGSVHGTTVGCPANLYCG